MCTVTIIPFHFTLHNVNLKKIGSLDEENFKKSNEVIRFLQYSTFLLAEPQVFDWISENDNLLTRFQQKTRNIVRKNSTSSTVRNRIPTRSDFFIR